jgi:DNA-binding HxlR family transcriptional regulator
MQLMDYLEWDVSNCSVGRAVTLVGQPWVVLVMREVSRGLHRFKDIQDHLGISRSVLADRLELLLAHGVLERREYREPGQRRRSEYHLTEKGRDLYPAINALREWGDKYLADPEGPSLLVSHRGCGAPVHTRLLCEAGHTVTPEELDRTPGPAARPRVNAA